MVSVDDAVDDPLREETMMTTLAEVAAVAGVSKATASLVLSGKDEGRVSAVTAERVRAVASELGYVRDALAGGMRSGRTRSLGVIAERVLSTPYAVAMIDAILRAARELGWSVLLTDAGGDEEQTLRAVRELRSRKVDVVVYAAMYHQLVHVDPKLGRVAVLDGFADRDDVPSVVPDEVRAAREATAHLIALGHTRIAHITDSSDAVAVGLRIQGYREALEESGIRFDESLVLRGGNEPEGADASADRLLALDPRPTAVFCYNDGMAAGVYRRTRRAGLRIPEDLSVVGFDDLTLISTNLDPGLTTMRLPHYEMADWLIRALLDDSATPAAPGITRMPCELVMRESTAVPTHRP